MADKTTEKPATEKSVPGKAVTERKAKNQKYSFGWNPDLPDARDYLFAVPVETISNLPASVDLQSKCPAVYNQGELGSCTANALAAAVEFIHKPQFMPSRLFIYYNERVIEGTVNSDAGGQLRDGIKSIATTGVCPETEWPYVTADFKEKPNAKAFSDAAKTKATTYYRVARDLNQMKGCLAEGYPFVFGFTVYDSFESMEVAKTGVVHLPATGDTAIGGHAVLAVGYDSASQTFLVRNSWGPEWGKKGYFTMPFAYLLSPHLASDFWTVRMET